MKENNSLFLVILTYKVDLDIINQHREKHLKFINEYYKKGTFIVTGRQVPFSGGIIISKSESKAKLKEVLEGDPYAQHNLVDYTIYEFTPTQSLKWL